MPFSLPLPTRARAEGWKVKIRDKERLEPPHITIMKKTKEWRQGLRDGEFMVPPGGSWSDILDEVEETIFKEENWNTLKKEWNARYSENPVEEDEDD